MKKNIFDFSDFDDNIVNSIAENYPDMNKSQQKSICRKIRKRLNISDDSVVGDVVSGIEIARKRNPWYICGTVAAAVFAVALIPTAFKALKNAPDGPENIQGPPAVDMATAPVEDEEKSTAAVTTKIGESDIIAEVTAPQPPTDETTTVLPTSSENPEKTKETEAPPPPPVTEEKRTTTKALRTTVPQAPPAPTSAPAVSTPVTTTKPVTVPPAPPAISEGDIFDMLANLSYRQETCDGIPDYTLQADDGTKYRILTGCNHVWRSGRSGYQEADLTPEILEWIKKYGEPYKNSINVSPPTAPSTTNPAKVTTSVTTTKAVTAPPAPPAVSEDGIFNTLANLSYSPYTCDGIPDYILTAEDDTTYQILVGCKHVWRNGREEADITPEILEWVKKYGEPYKR